MVHWRPIGTSHGVEQLREGAARGTGWRRTYVGHGVAAHVLIEVACGPSNESLGARSCYYGFNRELEDRLCLGNESLGGRSCYYGFNRELEDRLCLRNESLGNESLVKHEIRLKREIQDCLFFGDKSLLIHELLNHLLELINLLFELLDDGLFVVNDDLRIRLLEAD